MHEALVRLTNEDQGDQQSSLQGHRDFLRERGIVFWILRLCWRVRSLATCFTWPFFVGQYADWAYMELGHGADHPAGRVSGSLEL